VNNPDNIDTSIDTIHKRLLADVDDHMEFVGTIWQPKDRAALQVAEALSEAREQIKTLIEKAVVEARIDEFNISNKYIDIDYLECNGWKCRLPYCGSCYVEDEAKEASTRLKKERADRIAQLSKESKKEEV
jgi:hypothetical protein